MTCSFASSTIKVGLIERLEAAAQRVRDADHDFVQAAFECVRAVANLVPQPGTPGATPSSLNAAVQFQLERCVMDPRLCADAYIRALQFIGYWLLWRHP